MGIPSKWKSRADKVYKQEAKGGLEAIPTSTPRTADSSINTAAERKYSPAPTTKAAA